jgi:segregation and condensation protein A
MVDQDPTAWPDGEGPLRRTDEAEGESFHVDVAGFEGPLDLLLELARHHKIDLTQISMVALADQYLSYIDRARRMRIEVAADYLVMAAWLAYLKSRLLLPVADDEEALPEDLAQRLAFRLQRLQAMRDAAARIMARNQLNRDVFARGAPEPLVFETRREYADNLIDLLKAYAQRRQKQVRHKTYTVKRQPVWTIKDARGVLERLIGHMDDWGRFDGWLFEYLADPGLRSSVIASSFTASLELAREGQIEMRQERAFTPIYMRRAARAA